MFACTHDALLVCHAVVLKTVSWGIVHPLGLFLCGTAQQYTASSEKLRLKAPSRTLTRTSLGKQPWYKHLISLFRRIHEVGKGSAAAKMLSGAVPLELQNNRRQNF